MAITPFWAKMVEETRILERALGSADKFIAKNEEETQIVQRRCLRASRDIKGGEIFTRAMIDANKASGGAGLHILTETIVSPTLSAQPPL